MAHRSFIALLLATAAPAAAEEVRVDARAPAAAVTTDHIRLGSATAPDGTRLGVNSRYLTLNDKPWMPVMGEIHFVRLPADEWDSALAKMKASGVDIVATYLFWNYHEERPGKFDWSGDRDVRRFVQLAQQHGMKVVVRLGPWAHGEVRYGGVPDWIVRQLPTRGSDPAYMRYVDRYWGEIAGQLKGLLWKDGGPIIGVQLENEYNLTGPGEGRQHIADLKAMAIRRGFDVPFYTVTGWDGAVYPRGEVVPVFGGYADEPWGVRTSKLPPKETYAFRFTSRVSGNLGAQTRAAGGDADPDIPYTPFLGAEFGGGVPTMYRRRPVMSGDDVAAMVPVQLGSGVNLYGYYMYYGGRNLIGDTTLEENTAIGGFNDLPLIDYDFQAPFGAYGETGLSTPRIRPFHLLMQSYGEQLAPMTVRQPTVTPRALDDLATLRWSARASGDSAFVFVNNYVRQYPMAAHGDVRFRVELPGGTITFPSRGVMVAPGDYFIWPVGMDLGGQTLSWASAQPVTRIDGPEGPLHVFMAKAGSTPEFAFPAGTRVSGAAARTADGHVLVTVDRPGRNAVLTVTQAGRSVRILVLDQEDARRLWRVELGGRPHLILSEDQLVAQGPTLAFTSLRDPDFSFSVWPALPRQTKATLALSRPVRDGLFERYEAHATPRHPTATLTALRAPGIAPPVPLGGRPGHAIQPWPESFGASAGGWQIDIAPDALQGLDDAFLRLDWAGDIGRLFSGTTLLDDHFYDGREWRIGLRRNQAALAKPLTVRVNPLRADAPVYIDDAMRPKLPAGGQIATIRSVSIDPQYRLEVRMP